MEFFLLQLRQFECVYRWVVLKGIVYLIAQTHVSCIKLTDAGFDWHGEVSLIAEVDLDIAAKKWALSNQELFRGYDMVNDNRLIVGISGASGIIFGIRALSALREMRVESHLIASKAAEMTLGYETDLSILSFRAYADHVYKMPDVGAPIASGSFRTKGMLIAPCSVRTMSEIATGVTSSLLTRAADVVLKERKPLVLMVRETPFHLGHIRTMATLTEMGAIICPPLPAFYAKPQTIEDLVDQSVGRALDLFGLDWKNTKRWGEDLIGGQRPSSTKNAITDA
jgi:4-hydroxy-3-polyprenylbenzoate decarboxylase